MLRPVYYPILSMRRNVTVCTGAINPEKAWGLTSLFIFGQLG
jgi:hypothetical protein